MKNRFPLLDEDPHPYSLSETGLGDSPNGNTVEGLFVDHGADRAATVEAPGSLGYLDQVLGENEIVHQVLAELRADARAMITNAA